MVRDLICQNGPLLHGFQFVQVFLAAGQYHAARLVHILAGCDSLPVNNSLENIVPLRIVYRKCTAIVCGADLIPICQRHRDVTGQVAVTIAGGNGNAINNMRAMANAEFFEVIGIIKISNDKLFAHQFCCGGQPFALQEFQR